MGARFFFYLKLFIGCMAKKISKIALLKLVNPPPNLVALQLSSRVFFGTFLTLSFLVAGLLYSASYRVSHMVIVSPVATNPNARLERSVRKVVNGYPIEKMIPYIAGHKKITAAFLVGIAKKESNWGKRVPVDEAGDDCFNYWGFKGAGSRGVEMGHGCFGSREEAIEVVGNRIDALVDEYQFDTPEELIVWKCGWNCDGHSPQSVKKWISDVKFYFNKVNKT